MEEVNISSEKDEMEEVEQVESCRSNKRQRDEMEVQIFSEADKMDEARVPRVLEWGKQDNWNSQLVVSTFQIALANKSDKFVSIRRLLVEWLTEIGEKKQWNKKKWFTLDNPLQMLEMFEKQLDVWQYRIDREESGKIVVKNMPHANALVQYIFSNTTNHELYGKIIEKCQQYHAEDSALPKLASNPLRPVTELILLCEENMLGKLFDYLAGKILQHGDAIGNEYKKDVPMKENVPIKPKPPLILSRYCLLQDVVAWCVFSSVAIELDPEYETMLNELRTTRLKPGGELEALLADEPDPLPMMYPKIYLYANADEMYANGDLFWYAKNENGKNEVAALVKKLP